MFGCQFSAGNNNNRDDKKMCRVHLNWIFEINVKTMNTYCVIWSRCADWCEWILANINSLALYSSLVHCSLIVISIGLVREHIEKWKICLYICGRVFICCVCIVCTREHVPFAPICQPVIQRALIESQKDWDENDTQSMHE